MSTAVVLGGGMVGAVIASDLAGDFSVTLCDASDAALSKARALCGGAISACRRDLSDVGEIRAAVADADVVVGALPSRLGFVALETVIDAGKPYCDISFMEQDATEVSARATAKGVTAIVDCGVAPGMSNLLAGQAHVTLKPCQRIAIYVGGVPKVRRWPFEYKAGFAPHDVIEEYTRPARFIEDGRIVTKEALSEVEPIEFAALGTLEAFNSDGLRSLLHTIDGVPYVVEKTVRYPGHAELMRVFRETGLFSEQPVEVDGVAVKPRDVTSAVLFPKWTFEEGEADVTVMRVEAEGEKDGKPTRLGWELVDRYDPKTGVRSMSRVTAFPAAIVARMLIAGELKCGPGVHPPETLARQPGLTDRILQQLSERGVQFHATQRPLTP